jgi:NAD-dependent deacetylase
MLKHASRIIVLTGSGLSEASGLPYYGSQGFWREEEMSIDLDETDSSIDQEVLLTKTFLSLRPKLVWKWVTHFCDTRLKTPPTPSHWLLNDVIEELGRLGKQVSIVTQSIDNFHE